MEIEIEVGIECNLRFEEHERKNGREIKFKYNQKLNKCNWKKCTNKEEWTENDVDKLWLEKKTKTNESKSNKWHTHTLTHTHIDIQPHTYQKIKTKDITETKIKTNAIEIRQNMNGNRKKGQT